MNTEDKTKLSVSYRKNNEFKYVDISIGKTEIRCSFLLPAEKYPFIISNRNLNETE